MAEENSNESVALIVGVTGMVGVALAEALKKPAVLGGPWKVYGVARRPLPTWFPSSLLDNFLTFDALNTQETHQKLSPFSSEITHVFWVALQIGENEGININLNSTMLKNVLNSLRNCSNSKLKHVTLQTGTKQYMGPIFDPILSDKLIPHEPPFREDYPRIPFPNFYYALEDILSSYAHSFTYSIHRSSVIIGVSTRSLYNSLLSLCVYASICKYKGWEFRFPGNKYSWEHFWDFSDSRVLADQQIWASVTDKAKNQAFNCTNGDVFSWKSMWKLLCEIFELEFLPFDEKVRFDLVEFMKDKGGIWDEIVEKYGLFKTKMEEVTCFEALQLILHFEFEHVCSMNKSKEFGFFGFANTLESIKFWVEKMRQMNILSRLPDI
ncbi:hypothetical protein M9H77_36897 [Catharanthus roseus]|uniref:Uncharacterized protein n=2 Tax=Catharanthus roseus TaxID=4058 RepID=A0ACB9ZVA5_CATRO|nr:progesterone 5-beta-reductase 6 [Catharanthus roseus]KAI5650892.1 hypothetical protein M9H77_36897 [Catharanthus roseus]